MPASQPSTSRPAPRVRRAALLLGFALGGFFDGILLHQILQWHHLLSGVDGLGGDVGVQILADGLFHLAMYAVALAGVYLLLRGRRELAAAGPAWMAGHALLGFGAWHAIDAVLVHWTLGWHRIRMDAVSPLAWDVGWLSVFGIAALAGGGWLLRRADGPPPAGGAGSRSAACLLAGLAGTAAALQAWPWQPPSSMVVVLLPGASARTVFDVADKAGAPVVATLRAGTVWVLGAPAPGARAPAYERGALVASTAWLPAGCFAWLQAQPPRTPVPAPAG